MSGLYLVSVACGGALLVLISLAAQSGSTALDSRFFIHPLHGNLDDYFGTI
jgi:hypothetical protein